MPATRGSCWSRPCWSRSALAAASVACAQARVRGSGNVVARDVAVPSFSRLEAASGFEVGASVGGQPPLTLRVDDNVERHAEAGVSGDTLRIGLRQGTSVSDATLQATITAPSLVQSRAPGRRGSACRSRWRPMTSGSSCRAPAAWTGPPSSGR
jgi:hypothetical protein